jgi:Tfp pilus assembly protein PilV
MAKLSGRASDARTVAIAARRHRRPADDAGITLIDVLVSMSIMAVVMALFTAGIAQMYRISYGNDAQSVVQSQISTALLRLDPEIRYAAGVSRTGSSVGTSSSATVDFLQLQTGVTRCVQLRVSNGQLQQRTWTWQATPFAPTDWTTLASGITSATPFTYLPATSDIAHQQLRVRLSATAGGAARTVVRESDITYTALNTTTQSGSDDCIAGRA